MRRKPCLAFVVAVISGTILSITEVDAQSTVDDSASCESSTLVEAVNIIREDLKDMKNLLGSHQEDLKAACASNQQQRPQTESSCSQKALAASLIGEYRLNAHHTLSARHGT